MQMPEPDQQIMARRDAICAALRQLVPAASVVSSAEGRRAYDADGLSAYRQLPLAVVLLGGHNAVVGRLDGSLDAWSLGGSPQYVGTATTAH